MKWKMIKDAEGYECTKCGKVRSIDRIVTFKTRNGTYQRSFKGKELSCCEDSQGYLKVGVGSCGSRGVLSVHKIIYETWGAEEITKWLTIDHIDNNKLNNHIDNLQLLSVGDNVRKNMNAVNRGVSKNLEEMIQMKKDDVNIIDIAKEFNCSGSYVEKLLRGKVPKVPKVPKKTILKVPDADVDYILNCTDPYKIIAEKFGCSDSYISAIKKNKRKKRN